jgi:CMP-N,N'-diacetyllegionaminic acid synthase
MNKILTVVTARAGSSLKNKNFRIINSKPLFIWSILSALNVKEIDKIRISSNCSEVRDIFYTYISTDELFIKNKDRLIFINRPNEISGPMSKNEEALQHAVVSLKEYYKFEPDMIINLQPTSPVRNNELLHNCIEAYKNSGCDSLITVQKITPFMWQKINKESHFELKCYFDIYNRKMRQSFSEEEFFLHDSGNIYCVNKDILMKTNCRIGNNPYLFEITDYQALQIDSEFHFDIIEQMSKKYGSFI